MKHLNTRYKRILVLRTLLFSNNLVFEREIRTKLNSVLEMWKRASSPNPPKEKEILKATELLYCFECKTHIHNIKWSQHYQNLCILKFLFNEVFQTVGLYLFSYFISFILFCFVSVGKKHINMVVRYFMHFKFQK